MGHSAGLVPLLNGKSRRDYLCGVGAVRSHNGVRMYPQMGLAAWGGQGLGHICLLTITHESVVVTAADCVRADSQMASSAATNLAWRPRPRDKATRGGRLPRLVRLVLSCSCRSGRGRLGRSGSFFCCSFGQCGRRSCVVLLETAVFIFATRAAMTGLVAPRSCTGRSSH